MQEQEIWKDIKGYEGLYQVSNLGRVKSLARKIKLYGYTKISQNIIMSLFINEHGYYSVMLSKNGKKKNHKVHQLVAKAFIPNPENKEMINHKDCNRLNNNVKNLEWCTNSENQIHAIKNGLKIDIGAKNHNSKLTDDDVRYIRSHYIPKDKNFGQKALAKKFGIGMYACYCVISGRRYKNVI